MPIARMESGEGQDNAFSCDPLSYRRIIEDVIEVIVVQEIAAQRRPVQRKGDGGQQETD